MKAKVMYKCPKCNSTKMSPIAGAKISCKKCNGEMSQTKTMNK
jgi:DNA-directed RNA polymerase subunit RPC12/RpoP